MYSRLYVKLLHHDHTPEHTYRLKYVETQWKCQWAQTMRVCTQLGLRQPTCRWHGELVHCVNERLLETLRGRPACACACACAIAPRICPRRKYQYKTLWILQSLLRSLSSVHGLNMEEASWFALSMQLQFNMRKEEVIQPCHCAAIFASKFKVCNAPTVWMQLWLWHVKKSLVECQ